MSGDGEVISYIDGGSNIKVHNYINGIWEQNTFNVNTSIASYYSIELNYNGDRIVIGGYGSSSGIEIYSKILHGS